MQHESHSVAGSAYTCNGCGYDLSGSAIGGVCPECGMPVQESLRTSTVSSGSPSGTAITCMVLGISSLAACGLIGPFAIWLYYKTRNDVQAGLADPSSMGMAKAGLITGWIATGLTLIACPIYMLLIFMSNM